MATKLLHEIVEESNRRSGPPDLLPYPTLFAECLAEMTKTAKGTNGHHDNPTAFVTTSGLRFVFSGEDEQ